jgi:hypothetical protein
MAENVRFESTLEITDGDPPWHILRVPKSEVADFGFKGNLRRVICSLNGAPAYNCSLFPSKGDYFLTLSKQARKSLGVNVGDSVTVELRKDESKYGMPMPEEFAEVLKQDPDGEGLFNALLPGDQRLMLKLIVFVKDPDRRIARALAGIELLKRSNGKFVYSEQHLAMKIVTSAGKHFKFVR